MRKNPMRAVVSVLAITVWGLTLASGQNGGVSSGYPTPKDGFNASQQRGHGLYLRYCVAVTEPTATGMERTHRISIRSRGILWERRSSAGRRRPGRCRRIKT